MLRVFTTNLDIISEYAQHAHLNSHVHARQSCASAWNTMVFWRLCISLFMGIIDVDMILMRAPCEIITLRI